MNNIDDLRFRDVLSGDVAAHVLHVTERTLANWNRSGKLKPIGVFGRKTRVYLKQDVETLKVTSNVRSGKEQDNG